jgi:hypothetical protein
MTEELLPTPNVVEPPSPPACRSTSPWRSGGGHLGGRRAPSARAHTSRGAAPLATRERRPARAQPHLAVRGGDDPYWGLLTPRLDFHALVGRHAIGPRAPSPHAAVAQPRASLPRCLRAAKRPQQHPVGAELPWLVSQRRNKNEWLLKKRWLVGGGLKGQGLVVGPTRQVEVREGVVLRTSVHEHCPVLFYCP